MAAVEQVAFEIPAYIAKGIASGDFVRYGGIVRDASGHIVKHLAETSVTQDAAGKSLKAVAAKAAQNPKTMLLGIGIAAITAGGAALAAHFINKNKEAKQQQLQECLVAYNSAMVNYLEAAKSGQLNKETIDAVLRSLDELETASKNGAIKIEVSLDQLREMVFLVGDYTERLAKANSMKFKSKVKKNASEADAFKVLRVCLEKQRDIFDQVA